MIGHGFRSFLKEKPPRYLPKVNLFIEFLKFKSDEAINRASYINNNTYGIRLLSEIIKASDIASLLLTTKDQRALINAVNEQTKELEKYIDIRNGKTTTNSLFINSSTACFELISPSRRMNPLIDIPFDKDYKDPKWTTIKPFRIVDMSSCDLTFKVYNDQLDYYSRAPTYSIYTLDCFALVCKFIAYYKANPKGDIDQSILNFLHYEIIVPTLINDSVSIWMRNVYSQQFMTDSPLESKTATMWDNVNIDTLGTEFTAAMVDIVHLKTDLVNESIDPLTVMSSLILSTDKKNFISYYKELIETTGSPSNLNYAWIEGLKNSLWFEFILLMMSFSHNYPNVVSAKRFILRDIRITLMSKPWNNIRSSIPYKSIIKSKLEGMYHYLRDMNK